MTDGNDRYETCAKYISNMSWIREHIVEVLDFDLRAESPDEGRNMILGIILENVE